MTATATELALIDAPGLYGDVDELDYHSDRALAPDFGPSLSSTGARTILESPKRFRWQQDHPAPPKKAFDLGHVAHAKVLGVGLGVAVIPDEHLDARGALSTKAGKEWAAQARAEGLVPVKSDLMAAANAMAEEVLAHPVAGPIFSQGEPEQSAYTHDPETGVLMRARIDWLHPRAATDLKTGRSADPSRFGKTAAEYGYAIQADWYLTVLAALGYDPDLPFLHVLVESDPPHLVSVVQLDDEALEVGHVRARRALELYAEAMTSGVWPSFAEHRDTEITAVALPSYHVRNYLPGDLL